MQKFQPTFSPGSIIRGRYVVESTLSKDSSAAYLIRDQQSQQQFFALKEVIDPRRKKYYRYNFESTKLPVLDHPALPCVYDIFRDKNDRIYILMEYIEGPNLEEMRLERPDQRFSLSRSMVLIAPILEAVIYLHSNQPPIIHQNIKPSSIIATGAGTSAALVGFGHEKEYDAEKTVTIVRHATSSYGAPEQYVGISNPRTDIYALGATLYTLLTGTIPPDSLLRMKKLSNMELDPLLPANQLTPTVPFSIAETIHRAMSINSDDRFSTVEQFSGALRQSSNVVTIRQQQTEHTVAVQTEENTELDFNPPLLSVTLASEEVKTPVIISPQESAQVHSAEKQRMTVFTLFAVIVTLCASIGVGVSLWFYTAAQHRPISITPTTISQPGQTSSRLLLFPSRASGQLLLLSYVTEKRGSKDAWTGTWTRQIVRQVPEIGEGATDQEPDIRPHTRFQQR